MYPIYCRKPSLNTNKHHDFTSVHIIFDFLREIGYKFYEKMDDFSSQLGMIKCSEIRHFSM